MGSKTTSQYTEVISEVKKVNVVVDKKRTFSIQVGPQGREITGDD